MPVLDTSVVLAHLLNEPGAGAVLPRLLGEDAHVPDLLHIEVANALISAVRRNRLAAAQVQPCFTLVRRLPVRTHDSGPLLVRALDISLRHGRRPYDGVFLALAEGLGQELLTLDAALVNGVVGTSLARHVRVLT